MFDKATTLAAYKRQSVDADLRKVVHHLKDTFKLFACIILQFKLAVTIESNEGIKELYWELTIKKAHQNLDCVLNALGVIHQGLFHSKILMKHVQQILDEGDIKGASIREDEQKLRELKDNLLNLNNFLDSVLLHYSGFDTKLPAALIKDIKRTTKKIYHAIMQLKSVRLDELIPESMVTEEDLLCSVLGLQDDFGRRLKNLSEEIRQHKTDMNLLMCFIKELDESQNVDFQDVETLQQSLQKMGFIENRSKVIAKWITEQAFPDHRSLLAWAQIYIENLFKYDIFLSDQVSKFPFKETTLNKWFTQKVDDHEDEDGHVPEVFVVNTTKQEDAVARIKEKVVEFKNNNPKERLFYHGTDHQSAVNILESGIRLGKGTSECDFSDGNGFYLADDFDYALTQYAMIRKYAALLIFHISDDCLTRGLDLSGPENRKDLRAVVNYFKSGGSKKHGLDKKLYNSIQNCHYIFGPISRDGKDDGKSSKWDSVNQICIKNKDMAKEIGGPSHIAGIIFLNTEGNQLVRR